MGSFRYKAVNESGAEVVGAIIADSATDARARLREMKLFPERLVRTGQVGGRLFDWLPGRRLSAATHVTVFTRQCAVLLASGVQIVDALGVLSGQCEHARLAAAIAEIREAISSGSSFAEGLVAFPQFFDRSYVGMIASGEKSGTMDLVFQRLAGFLERRRAMQSRFSSALIYPAILVVMVIGLLAFLSGYVVPQIAPLLERQGRPLPLSTWLLFRIGDVVQNYGWIIALVLALMFASLAAMRRTPRGRDAMDRFMLRIPLVGKLIRKSLVSRFSMAFGTLLRTGVPALEALEVLAGLTPNATFASEISKMHSDVLEGKNISSQMHTSRVFPPMVGYMVAVGERSGNLAQVLEHVAEAYDMEVEIESRRLLTILEPALILIMAAVVGFIAMSLMVTVLEIGSF